jgi:ribose-phosphate pyrophosphokinase
VLVSPDQGAVEKVRIFGTSYYGTESFREAVIEKKRDQIVPHKAMPLDLYGDVKDKIAIIVDDMVVSGSTVIPAVELCLERGAKEVYAAVIHHDFTTKAPELLQNSKLKKFFTTNTIPLKEEHKFEKLEEISVAPLIQEELK